MKRFALIILMSVAALSLSAQTKTFAVLGDSYSTFQGYIPAGNAIWYFDGVQNKDNDVVKVEQTWWYQLAQQTGYQLVMNDSYSGATIAHTGYRGEDYADRSFMTRMYNLRNPDIILVFGCTNDSWAGVPIGEYKFENWTNEDLYSYRPALAYTLYNMKKIFPDAEIHFILNSELKESIDVSTKTICEFYGINCIELSDNVHKLAGHPSIAGMKTICEEVLPHVK